MISASMAKGWSVTRFWDHGTETGLYRNYLRTNKLRPFNEVE